MQNFMQDNYKWELKQKDTSVFSNDIKELQRLQGELGGFIYRVSQEKVKNLRYGEVNEI